MSLKEKLNRKENIPYIMILLLIISSLVVLTRTTGDDYWFHLRIGQDLWNGTYDFYKEQYSWYGMTHNLVWYNHEWITQFVLYGISRIFGVHNAARLYMASLYIIIYLVVYRTNQKWLNGSQYGVITYTFLYALILTEGLTPRPHLIGLLLFALLLKILEKIRNEKNYSIIQIILYFLFVTLWNNLHGGSSILGAILPLMYCIVTIMPEKWLIFSWLDNEFVQLNREERVRTLGIYGILTMLGCISLLVHPNGIVSALQCFETNEVQKTFVQEWRPTTIQNNAIFLIGLLIAVSYIIKRSKKLQLIDVLLVGAFSVLTFMSVRYKFWFVLVLPMLVKYIQPDIPQIESKVLRKQWNSILVVAFLVIVIVCNVPNYQLTDTIPEELIEIIRKEAPQRLFNTFNEGDYLIYKDIPVFYDGRGHMYQDSILKEGILFTLGSAAPIRERRIVGMDGVYKTENSVYINGIQMFEPEKFLETHQFDYLLLCTESVANTLLVQRPDMELLYQDKNFLLWKAKN